MAEDEKLPERPPEPRPQEQRRKQRRGPLETENTHAMAPDESGEESEAGSVEKTSEPVAHVAARESKAVSVAEQRLAQAKAKHEAVESSGPKIKGHTDLLRFRRRRKR